ncbi:MAG: MBL fold metallo-hydrolase [Candidatus Krumholzibacteriia bacterium]
MLIRYVGHASLSIEVAGQRVLTDPWWNGPAYTGQWYHYPLPRVERSDIDNADFIYISHGHEDHLHIPTLRTISKNASLVIPRFRNPGMRDCLASLGFRRILEIGHGQKRRLAPGLDATVYINKDDSILVLEGDGRTLIDANDALHASPRHVIDHFCAQIRTRHPRIDTLFIGYGGASWFPNCIQPSDSPSFDARRREQVFAQNFAYIARQLDPRMVFPFAATFVLLEDHLRWINAVRFRMGSPCDELRRQGAYDIVSHHLMPGDRILGDQILTGVQGPPSAEEAEAEIRSLFATKHAEISRRKEMEEERIQRVLEHLLSNASNRHRRVFGVGQRIQCRIDLRDLPEVSFMVDARRGRIRIDLCDRLRLAPMILTTRLDVLEAWVTQDYGYESISIGYGAVLQLRHRDIPLHMPLLNLLGCRPLPPTGTERLAMWLHHPWRCFDTWRRNLHLQWLAWRMRKGDVQCWNDMYSFDQDRWSPLREEPLNRASA